MKTCLRWSVLFFAITCMSASLWAQQIVSGTVTDESGVPMPGATVVVQGTNNGTTTDFDGKYQIQASQGQTLMFSFVGYASQSVTVGSSATVDVQLQADNELDEVVLTALGLEKKKDNDLSSSTSVKKEAISKSGESGIIQGLAGKTSGLKITRNTGDPGSGAYIQIRGQNTINGSSSPLIILDGVPISNTGYGGGTDGVAQQSRLNDLSSEDIESVSVLKGASAAAVWGTGAANGVLVIKTKEGRTGIKDLSVNIRSTVSFDKINVEFEKQDKFGQGYPQWWLSGTDYSSDGSIYVPNTGFSWGDKIADRSGEADDVTVGKRRFESNTGNIIYPLINKNSKEVFNKINRDQVFGTGLTWDKSISIRYSDQNSSTYFSYNDWDQDGIIKGKSTYRRQSLKLNNKVNLNDDFTFKFSSYYAKINSDRIQQGSNLNGLYLGYLRTSPDFDNRDYIGTYYDSDGIPEFKSHRGYRRYLGDSAPVYNNPGWTINEQDNPNIVERFTITPEVFWKITDKISLTSRYGIDYYTDHRENYFPVNSAAGNSSGLYYEVDIKEKTENFNAFLQASHKVNEDIDFSWILGTTVDRNQFSLLGGSSSQFTNPGTNDLRIFGNAEAENESVFNYNLETRKIGGYLILNSELFDQFFLELTGRYEKPSTVEKATFYPSASFGWKFIDNLDSNVINFGKIRFSYGEIGIEPDPYGSKTTFGPGGISSSWGDGLSAAAYGNPFTRASALGNPDLTIERVKEFEAGTDLRFFNNTVTLGLTYYDRLTEDAILFLDVPPSTGYSSTPSNAATISNKGLEVDLSLKLFNKSDFKWSLDLSYSHNKNLVKDLSGVKSVFLAGFTGTSSRVVEGHSIATLWGGKFERDSNGEIVLDSNGFPEIDAEEGVLGDPNPDWIGGLGTVLSYKGFSLSAQFETSQGNDHWFGTEGVLKYFGIHPETANETVAYKDLKTYDGRTISEGTTFRGNIGNFGGDDVALDSEWYTSNGGGFGSQSETFVDDASWTRLREVTLSYKFPEELIKKIKLSNLEMSLSGRNLALWTKVKGFDPDINLTGATKGRGLDYFTNPSTRSIILTVKVGL